MSLRQSLSDGIGTIGITVSDQGQARLVQYLDLIKKWNQVHNLTAVRDTETMMTRHLLDSLSVLPHITGPRIVDIGSGAGLPGIPLALARPDWHVVLIESNHKKAAFLQQVRIELQLENIEVVAERAENHHSEISFNTVISRAFSDLADFIQVAGHLCTKEGVGGRLLAMKGVYPHEELTQIPRNFVLENVHAIVVPGLEAERHLVMLRRVQ
ncbi:MAG: 16S rRNA (guanine(527)-N(7))-methyltransferase RsmG [Nitrosomonadaceae bacterium]